MKRTNIISFFISLVLLVLSACSSIPAAGTYQFPNGEYVGSFSNGLPHGQGTFYFSDGSKYVGHWANGRQNGEGVFTDSDGAYTNGIWEDGVLVKVRSSSYGGSDHKTPTPAPMTLTDGATIRKVQKNLQYLGYKPGPIDGVFGPQTKRAIQEFQRTFERDIGPDGQVSEKLVEALDVMVSVGAVSRKQTTATDSKTEKYEQPSNEKKLIKIFPIK